MDVGGIGGIRAARIHDCQDGTLILRVQNQPPLMDVGLGGLWPRQDEPAVAREPRVVVAVCAIGQSRRSSPAGQQRSPNVVVQPPNCRQNAIASPPARRAIPSPRSTEHWRALRIANPAEAAADVIQGLVPSDLFEPIMSADAPKRREQPVVVPTRRA